MPIIDLGRGFFMPRSNRAGKAGMAGKNTHETLSQFVVLGIFLLFFGYLSYEIIRPYLAAILWAIILAIVSYPLYSLVLRLVRNESLASLINLVIILLLVLGPVSYFLYLLVNEVASATAYLQKENLLAGSSSPGFLEPVP